MNTTEMKEFVQGIALLWKENKRRETLYMAIMRKDHLGNLRRLCNQGHISSLLFQKEIQWIYDYFKCALRDSDLDQCADDSSWQMVEAVDGATEPGAIVRLINEAELVTIRSYQAMIRFAEKDGEAYRILREHLDRIVYLCDKFSRESTPYWERQTRGQLT